MTCLHQHGDFVDGIWICGQCWSKLDERPREYYWEDGIRGADDGGVLRRQMVRLCPVTTSTGETLGKFIGAMARRLMAVAGFSRADAVEYALDIMRAMGAEFGAPGEAWDTDAAWEIVAEDMQYWDVEREAGND